MLRSLSRKKNCSRRKLFDVGEGSPLSFFFFFFFFFSFFFLQWEFGSSDERIGVASGQGGGEIGGPSIGLKEELE